MSDASIPIGLLDTTIAIIAGVVISLVAIIYRRVRSRVDDLEEQMGELESRMIKIKRDIDTIFVWMFGQEEDPTNGGIAMEIEEGFDRVDDRFDNLDERFDTLIDELHDEDALEFQRNDIQDD